MHNTFKDLIVMILNVLVQFVLVIILVKSEIPTAMALALLVVGFMIYYIHHAAQDFVAPEDGDEQPEEAGQPTKKYHEGWVEEDTTKKWGDEEPYADDEEEPEVGDDVDGEDSDEDDEDEDSDEDEDVQHYAEAQKIAYQRYKDGMTHSLSSGIDGTITAGYGELTTNGYWQYPLEVNQDAPFNILPQPLPK